MKTACLSLLLAPALLFAGCDKDDVDTEDCIAITLDEGNSGTYTVDSTTDDHEKKHWEMPADIDHLVVTGTWSQTDWNMKLDVGEGWCPHSGTSYADAYDTGGELVIDLWASDLDGSPETFEEGNSWFAHFGLYTAAPPPDGSTSEYAFDVQACTQRVR